jgi:hypothetical protein
VGCPPAILSSAPKRLDSAPLPGFGIFDVAHVFTTGLKIAESTAELPLTGSAATAFAVDGMSREVSIALTVEIRRLHSEPDRESEGLGFQSLSRR